MSRILSRVPRRSVQTWPKETPEEWQKTETLWKRISLFIGLPATVLVGINTYLAEVEHKQHYQRKPHVPYEHLYIVNKPYPWGDGKHTLFFNPEVNATKKGYETPDPHE